MYKCLFIKKVLTNNEISKEITEMFVYEKNGKLNIMITGGKPAAKGVTPDIVIEPGDGTPVTAKVLINGKEVEVASE